MRVSLLLVVALLSACARAPAQSGTTLIYASPYAPSHPFSQADQIWIDWVEQHSNGRLHIHAMWSQSLLSSDQSMTELRHGVADIGLITPIYERGGEQLLRVQTGFYAGAQTFTQQVALYRCLQSRFVQLRAEFDGLHILAVQGGALPGLLTRTRAVLKLDDLHGLRVRAPTEALEVLRSLGADPVDMPMNQVYSALAKGIIDGVIAPPDTLRSLHFAEVAKYFTNLQLPRGAYPSRAINERRWQSLSNQDRLLLTASTPVWEAAMDQRIQASVNAGRAFGLTQKVTFCPIAADEQARFDELYNRVEVASAHALTRYGLDGDGVFTYARQLAGQIERSGEVRCGTDPGTP